MIIDLMILLWLAIIIVVPAVTVTVFFFVEWLRS